MVLKKRSTTKASTPAGPTDAEKMYQMQNGVRVCTHVFDGAKIERHTKAKKPTKKDCGLPMILCKECADSPATSRDHIKLVHKDCLEILYQDQMAEYGLRGRCRVCRKNTQFIFKMIMNDDPNLPDDPDDPDYDPDHNPGDDLLDCEFYCESCRTSDFTLLSRADAEACAATKDPHLLHPVIPFVQPGSSTTGFVN